MIYSGKIRCLESYARSERTSPFPHLDDITYKPVSHDHEAFLKKALKRKGFREAYEALEEGYRLAREMLTARTRMGLTQEEVAGLMGTTKSAISRLEASGKHAPSLSTLKKYAQAVGCRLEIKLVPKSRPIKKTGGPVKKQAKRLGRGLIHEAL